MAVDGPNVAYNASAPGSAWLVPPAPRRKASRPVPAREPGMLEAERDSEPRARGYSTPRSVREGMPKSMPTPCIDGLLPALRPLG